MEGGEWVLFFPRGLCDGMMCDDMMRKSFTAVLRMMRMGGKAGGVDVKTFVVGQPTWTAWMMMRRMTMN